MRWWSDLLICSNSALNHEDKPLKSKRKKVPKKRPIDEFYPSINSDDDSSEEVDVKGTEGSKDDKEFDAIEYCHNTLKEYHDKCNKYLDANKALVKELKALKDQNQKLMIANERANR